MCGIAGIFDVTGKRPVSRDLVTRMNDSQLHRGPDEFGFHFEPGLGLGHRRLSIIDLSTGQQPLYNEDGSVVIVYNGEVYNYRELIPELSGLGHSFRTKSDTEVIVHAWEQWGEDCVQRLRGMFAFALWDRNRETLFLARDRLGVKPLHYASLGDGTLAFGSELKSLVLHPAFNREIEPRAVEDYLAYGYVPEPSSIFRQALKLPPGCTLSVKRGAALPQPREYWDVPFKPGSALTLQAAQDELIERLREAVRIRLVSEVPLGAFLSGGVDSSAVVAMMAGCSTDPVNTCSISFGDPAFNEAAYARDVAERYRTRHFVERVDTDDFDLLDTLAEIYDEPFADSSAIPTFRLCQLARKHVTVALSGDGGDENFAGYRRYRWHVYEERVRSALPPALRAPVFGLLGDIYPKADWAPKALRAKSTLEALARNSVEGYFHSVSVMGDGQRQKLVSDSFRRDLQGYRAIEVLRRHAERAPKGEPLSLVQYLDMKTYLVGDILTKVDRASMAHSLEVREPLLDHPLMEWLSGLPPGLKLRGREGKYLFKRALEPYLPQEILYRPKMGFSVPLAGWFRGPLRQQVRDAVLGPVMTDSGYFNPRFLREMVDEHQSGARDYSVSLWSLLMFEAFLRKVMGATASNAFKAA
ncbi:MAG TPA: XrtA/PEP-CTERM system amidotransferase [Casimicrobiaceae bacterium]|nr:XrtA/PEP-CTERM system amidotransferase [Casimicrobiaceae bacterium]